MNWRVHCWPRMPPIIDTIHLRVIHRKDKNIIIATNDWSRRTSDATIAIHHRNLSIVPNLTLTKYKQIKRMIQPLKWQEKIKKKQRCWNVKKKRGTKSVHFELCSVFFSVSVR